MASSKGKVIYTINYEFIYKLLEDNFNESKREIKVSDNPESDVSDTKTINSNLI